MTIQSVLARSGQTQFFDSSRLPEGAGLYIHRNVLNKADVKALAKACGVEIDKDSYHEMHVTGIYSKTAPTTTIVADLKNTGAFPVKWSIFGKDTKHLVLEVTSDKMVSRNELFVASGCKSDFASYKPHVTVVSPFKGDKSLLSRANKALAAIAVQPLLILGPEIFNELIE